MPRPETGSVVLGPWTRAAVIRGDLTSIGVALVLGGVVVGGLAAAGQLPVLPAVGGAVAAVAAGVSLVRWSQARWRELLAEVIATHSGTEPGPSPVAWIDDGLWRSVNGFDPGVDGPELLVAMIEPGRKAFGSDARGAFTEPVLRPVAPAERALATPGAVPAGAPSPPGGAADALLEALLGTPGRFVAVGPRWPVCCGHLTTMVSIRAVDRHPAALYLSGAVEQGEDVDRSGRGIHGFVCRACGRRYATDPTW